ncbi:hypothetical protein LXA43DRAFT_983987 [Ganoderma leucocontextum]|nr:hypothetical protein LXA43DRAFT_983987 [Ganoderma leucocontextum]
MIFVCLVLGDVLTDCHPLRTSPSTGTATVVHAAGVSGAAGSGIGTSPSTTGVAPVNMPAKNAAGTTGGSFGLVGFLGFLGAALLG